MRWLLAIACAALLAHAQAPGNSSRGPVERAWDLVAQGHRSDAIELLKNVVGSDPRNADARLLLGSLLQESGSREECLEQLTAAVKLRPASAEGQNALGEAYRAFGDTVKARGPFERAVALDPRFATARVNLAGILLEAGEADTAAMHLDRALALMGEKKEAAYPLYLRAKIYTAKNQVPKAGAALERAVRLQPDFAEAWSDLGAARKIMGEDAAALDAFRRAVEISPDDAVAQTRLAAEYLAQNHPHDAVPHFQAAVSLAPGDQSALNGLQRALRADGQELQANQVKEQLVELLRGKDKSDQASLAAIRLNNEGAALEKDGNLRAALEKYRAAHQLDPAHVGIQTNYAIALLKLGEWKEGLAQLREAVRRSPNDAVLKAALADALRQAPVEYGGQGLPPTPHSH